MELLAEPEANGLQTLKAACGDSADLVELTVRKVKIELDTEKRESKEDDAEMQDDEPHESDQAEDESDGVRPADDSQQQDASGDGELVEQEALEGADTDEKPEKPVDASTPEPPGEQCEDHVDFAVICSFFQQFGLQLGIHHPIETVKAMLEDDKSVYCVLAIS